MFKIPNFLAISAAAILSISIAAAADLPNNNNPTGIELRGILKIGDDYSFSLKKDSKSAWRTLHQSAFGYELTRFSQEDASLTLTDFDGIETSIKLIEDENLALDVISDSDTQQDEVGYESIDPITLRDIHLVSARDKIRHQITPRSSTKGNHPSDSNLASSQNIDTQEDSSTEDSSTEATEQNTSSTTTFELTKLEKVALAVYEKHHVPTREAPTDIDVFHEVTPR